MAHGSQDVDLEREKAPAELRKRRRRRGAVGALTALAVVLAVGGGWWGVNRIFGRCAGMSEQDGQCYGVTDGRTPVHSDPGLLAAENAIRAENDRVAGIAEPAVTVALLTPVPHGDELSSASVEQVRSTLEGAAFAQQETNRELHTPKIRLVIADEGVNEKHWRAVVDELRTMRDDPSPLVAVTGIGVSTAGSSAAMREIAAMGIPMVGSTITADEFKAPEYSGLKRVGVANREEVEALSAQLAGRSGRQGRMMLINDKYPGDFYTVGLSNDFRRAFPVALSNVALPFQGRSNQMATQFDGIRGYVCTGTDTVLYAGRANVLRDLVGALGERGCPNPVTVVTGSDGSSIPHTDVPPGIRVVYAALAAPPALRDPQRNPAAQRYVRFERDFTAHFDRANLDNGWAIMNYDALLTASTAIHDAVANADSSTRANPIPDAASVRGKLDQINNARNAVDGADGRFYFDPGTGDPVRQKGVDVIEMDHEHPPAPLGK